MDNEIEKLFNCQEIYKLCKNIVRDNEQITFEVCHKGNNLDGFIVIVKYKRLYPEDLK